MIIDKAKVKILKKSIVTCRLCQGIDQTGALCIDCKETGLNYSYPQLIPIKILFIAKSPPKPGDGFFYDSSSINTKFRKRLFEIINASKLGPVSNLKDFTEQGYYLADTITCRWNEDKKEYIPVKIRKNCSRFIADLLELLQPKYVVAMGNYSQEALKYPFIQQKFAELEISKDNIIHISIPVVASNETDEERIKKLSTIKKNW